MDYAELANILEKILQEVSSKNSYHSLILRDYIQMIKGLNSIKNEIYRNIETGKYNLYQKDNQQITSLKEIRLHDFYLKLYHDIIAANLHKAIKNEISDILLVPNKNWKKSNPDEVFTGSGFTNGSGLSEVKYVIGEKNGSPVILGVQIQGVQFRLFIESKKDIAIKIAEKLYNQQLWFNFSNVIESGISDDVEYPKEKFFNTYSSEFYYRYVNLNNCNIKQLIKIILKYVNIIHKNKTKIMKALEKV